MWDRNFEGNEVEGSPCNELWRSGLITSVPWVVCNHGTFTRKIVWSDEAQFKLNGRVNRHNCVYWAFENRQIYLDKAVFLLLYTCQCDVSCWDLHINFICHPIAVWRIEDLSATRWCINSISSRFQDVSCRCAFKFLAWFPNLTLLNFYLWGKIVCIY